MARTRESARESKQHARQAQKEEIDALVFKPNCTVCDVLIAFPYIKTLCGHYYCPDCLQQNFKVGMTGEFAWPPSCCKIPFDVENSLITQALIGKETVARYRDLAMEFKCGDRLYCSNSECGAFIGECRAEWHTGPRICAKCSEGTCSACKGPWHQGGRCPKNRDLDLLTKLAKAEGWQTCGNCSQLVEKTYGCNHMR